MENDSGCAPADQFADDLLFIFSSKMIYCHRIVLRGGFIQYAVLNPPCVFDTAHFRTDECKDIAAPARNGGCELIPAVTELFCYPLYPLPRFSFEPVRLRTAVQDMGNGSDVHSGSLCNVLQFGRHAIIPYINPSAWIFCY